MAPTVKHTEPTMKSTTAARSAIGAPSMMVPVLTDTYRYKLRIYVMYQAMRQAWRCQRAGATCVSDREPKDFFKHDSPKRGRQGEHAVVHGSCSMGEVLRHHTKTRRPKRPTAPRVGACIK